MDRTKVMSRRTVLALAGVGAVVASLPLGGWRRVFAGPTQDPVRGLTLAEFTPHVGSTFDVQVNGGQTVPLTLLSAEQIGPFATEAKGVRGEAFSLILGDSKRARLVAGTHTLRHPEVGSLSLFMVPVGAGEKGRRYQVIVDHRTLAA